MIHRRHLLASGLAAAGFASPADGAGAGPHPGRAVTVLETSAAGGRLGLRRPLVWTRSDPDDAAVVIRPDRGRQRLFGFGAALTDAACAVLSRMQEAPRSRLLAMAFGPDGLRLGLCRVCIGASDYATELYGYDEGAPDPALSRFSIDHDRRNVLPRLRDALALRPDLFVLATPWSPPGWMKYGGSMRGGSLRPESLGSYAAYLGRFLDAYRAEGVPVRAMTIQNELDGDQAGRMPACTWPEEMERRFIVEHLGPTLRSRAAPVRLWLHDHNYELWGRVLDQLAHPDLRVLVDGVAWHGYAGSASGMARVAAAYPGLGMHWTEGGPTLTDPDYADGWARAVATMADALNHGARSLTVWNLVLDQDGGPNIGPFRCGGLLTVDATDAAVHPSGFFYGLMHVTRAFAPGDRLVESVAPGSGLAAAAVRKADGRRAAVVANTGPSRSIRIAEGGWSIVWDAPANAVASFAWS